MSIINLSLIIDANSRANIYDLGLGKLEVNSRWYDTCYGPLIPNYYNVRKVTSGGSSKEKVGTARQLWISYYRGYGQW